MGRPAAGLNYGAARRNDCARRRESVTLSKMGRLISGVEVLYEWVGDEILRSWPSLLRDWNSIEVPFQLTVGTLRVVVPESFSSRTSA